MHRRTDTQTHRHTDTQTRSFTDTRTRRQTDTQSHRHTDAQTHRHTDTRTHRDTHLCLLPAHACLPASAFAWSCMYRCKRGLLFVCMCESTHAWINVLGAPGLHSRPLQTNLRSSMSSAAAPCGATGRKMGHKASKPFSHDFRPLFFY